MAQNESVGERIDSVAELIRGLDETNAAIVNDQRRPPRMTVSLNTPGIPAALGDIIEEFGVAIESAQVGPEGGLQLVCLVEEEFQFIDSFKIRPHGNSLVVTLPTRALEVAGAENGTDLDIFARLGEFRLRTA